MADQCFGDALVLSSLPLARKLSASSRIKLMKVASIEVIEKGGSFTVPEKDAPFVAIIRGELRSSDLPVGFCRGDAFGYNCYLDASIFGPLMALEETTMALVPREHCAILNGLSPASLWICEFVIKIWDSHFEAGPVADLQQHLKLCLLDHIRAFAGFSTRALEMLLPCLEIRRASAGDQISTEYSCRREVLFVVRGSARVPANGSAAADRQLHEGDQYPEAAAMRTANGHASVQHAQRFSFVPFVAETDFVALSVTMNEYVRQIRLEDLRVAFAAPSDAQRSAADITSIVSQLRFPLFAQLPSDQRVRLARQLRLRVASEGQSIAALNDRPNRCFVVLTGRIDVLGGNNIVLGTIKAGEMCGAISWLMCDELARVELRAGERSEVLILHRDATQTILGKPQAPQAISADAHAALLRIPPDHRGTQHCEMIRSALLHSSCLTPSSVFRSLPRVLQVSLVSGNFLFSALRFQITPYLITPSPSAA